MDIITMSASITQEIKQSSLDITIIRRYSKVISQKNRFFEHQTFFNNFDSLKIIFIYKLNYVQLMVQRQGVRHACLMIIKHLYMINGPIITSYQYHFFL